MLITREEWRKWAESLNPGDKVIVKYGDMLQFSEKAKEISENIVEEIEGN